MKNLGKHDYLLNNDVLKIAKAINRKSKMYEEPNLEYQKTNNYDDIIRERVKYLHSRK